jgi:hypothetical protein
MDASNRMNTPRPLLLAMMVICSILFGIAATHAQEPGQPEFTSAPATAAQRKRSAMLAQARQQFVATMKIVLKEVMQGGQLEEANQISKTIENPDANMDAPLASLRGKAAQATFKAAAQRATQEYVIALKSALRVSLQAGQLEESNRISAEIKKMGDATAMQANATPGFINLLAKVDPDKNAVAGKWTIQKGALVSAGEGEERMELPYEPPEEYDFQVTFTKKGSNCVIQNLTGNGRSIIWVMGANGNYTFHYLKGAGIGSNRTTVKKAGIKDDRRYTSLIKVRKDGAEAYLDGKLITKWETDFADAEPAGFWALRNRKCLGVSAGQSAVTFHAIEVREISGAGKMLK